MQRGDCQEDIMPTTTQATFEVLGERYDLALNHEAMIDWCSRHGIEPGDVAARTFRIEEHDDGGYLAHFQKYVRTDDGVRFLAEDGDGFAKHPLTSIRVSDVPEGLR